MWKSFKLVSMLVLVFVLLVGCSSGSAPSTPNKQADGKKVLVYAQSIAISSLDTAGMQPQGYPAAYEASFAIYNGLVKFDDELKFKPDLATEWAVGKDGLTWTFKLRQGVKFQDDTPFNADAVVYAYERMLNREINVGAYPLWAPISKVAKVDDNTVQIITKEPYGGLLNVMAHGSALIPSPEAIKKYGKDYSLHPVGTGPYTVEKFDPGTELVLKRNDNYFGGKPAQDQLVFRYVADPSARIAALQSGQADVIDAVPVENAAQLKSDPNVDVIIKPGLQVFGIALNQKSELLQDQKVRQAFNYAIQKEAIVKVIFKDLATVMTSPLAPNTTGYVKSGEYKYDQDKAKQLLADAGWKPGTDGVLEKNGKKLKLKLRTPEGAYPNDVKVAEAIQNQLKSVGVAVDIEKVEKATFWNGLKVPAAKATYDMVLWGYNPSHGDGYIHLDAMFATNPSPDQNAPQWNYIWYSNSQVDNLLKEAKKTVDLAQRTELLGQVEKQIWDDAPYIWLYSNNIITAKKKNVSGVHVLPVVFTLVQNASK